ncbi:DNA-directed DNA polymerase [Staphylothermus hellenicus]|uniref:DNA polymerase n=1 Tax=Staphylothermus hellenicus (strain DSM 12710 / JCM 10830 / BK20S6-10-b1 / P8) TaxID=591019 RepID=D7DA72_STAHD|nr:DNA polymerase II [Staphylothermus hellenicus]ADI32668.1 DNA polymerase Pol2 [Staphylothermus hellenicus DSM 12710]
MSEKINLEFYFLDNSYEVIGNEPHIIIWGITRDGKRILLRDRRFRPYFYAILKDNVSIDDLARKIKTYSDPKSPIIGVEPVEKNYFGKKVRALKITTIIPEYVRKYREKIKSLPEVLEVVEADIRFSIRYIIDHDLRPCGWHVAEVVEIPKKPIYRVDAEYEIVGEIKPLEQTLQPDLRIMAFDIEVYNKSGTPRPQSDPVIIIGIMNNNGEIKQLLANKYDDKTSIGEFVNYVKTLDPDIIVGYNTDGFDWPYLIERSKYVGVKLDVTRRVGTIPRTSTYGHISVPGRLNTDLYYFAEEIPEVKVKSLENVAEYLGVMKKSERVIIEYIDIPKYWDDEKLRHMLLQYNIDDVKSTYGLAEKFLPFAMQLSNITGLPLDQIGAASVGFRLEWYLIREAFKYGELVPNRAGRAAESYRGAVVLKPVKGVHENIAVLDFSSMYPNIMIKYNVGPDTIIRNEKCDPRKHNIAPEVGHCFRKEPPGFFKKVLETLLSLRKQIKSEMKKYPPTSYEYRLLDERQKAVKVLANATYGYMGWVHARWYCRECAEAVTAWGRQTIKSAIELARKLGLKVIYGDTDSLFVTYDKDRVEKLIDLIQTKLGFEIKIDKIYKRVFFTEAKKRYAGLLEDGRIDIVGFEAVRGDWADIAKEVQEKVTEILLKENSVDKAIEYVRKVIADLKAGKIPLDKLIIWKTLSKRIEEYSVDAPHVVAAKKLVKAGIKISVNDKIGYVILKGGGKISSRAEPYIFVKDPKLIDTEYYIDHQIVPAALRILNYFGVTETQLKRAAASAGQKSLFDFFGGKK